MTDLATLGIRVEGQEVVTADQQLDGLAAAAGKAETATERLAAAARGNGAAMMTMNTAVRQQTAVLGAARSGMGLTVSEGLNLSRQFTDIGVTAAMGMNPLMIAIQQGPQLMDIFQQAAARTGASITTVMRGVAVTTWAALAPLMAILAPIGIAVAALATGWSLASRSITSSIGDVASEMNLTEEQLERLKEKNIATTATMGDAWNALGTTIKEMFVSVFGDQLSWVDKQWNSFLDDLTANTGKEVDAIAGFFVGSYRAIVATWENFPAVFSDIIAIAANAGGRILNDFVKNSVNELNFIIRQLNTAHRLTGGTGVVAREIGAPAAAFRTNRQTSGAAANVAGAFSSGYDSMQGFAGRQMDAWRQNTRDTTEARIRAGAGDPGEDAAAKARRAAQEVQRLVKVGDASLTALNARVPEMLEPLQIVADELRLINGLANDMAAGLTSAFGQSGAALGELMTTMSGYQSRLAEINLAEKEFQLTAAQAERERSMAQVQNYGDMIAAAKGFFEEGSDGYKALQTAEQAYRVFQFAMMVQAMVMGGQETAATVGQNAIKALSHGVVAVARAMASLPFPLNLAAGAATIAALAAIGVKLAGGGGGGGSTGTAPVGDQVLTNRRLQAQTSLGNGASAGAQGSPWGGTQVFDLRGAVVTEQLMADVNAKVAAGEARVIKAVPRVVNRGIARGRIGEPAWGAG